VHLFQAFPSEVVLPSCSPSQGLPINIDASLRINSVPGSMLAKVPPPEQDSCPAGTACKCSIVYSFLGY
jgi:hypothetical protein